MSENPRLFALFIDGDNVQVPLVPQILEKLNKYRRPIIRKVYLNRPSFPHWEEIINEYSLEPVWVPNNTPRKNAADIALVIDAMDLLYQQPDIKGFCIISSDSDFTRLATYLVGKNRFMLGIGEEKTPKSFAQACSRFVYIEELLDIQPTNEQSQAVANQTIDQPNDNRTNQSFEALFFQAYENMPRNADGWVQLVELREEMNALDNEFQSSEFQSMRQLAEKVKALAASYPKRVIEIDEKLEGKPVIHYIRMDYDTLKFIEAYKQAPKEDGGWVKLSPIGSALKKDAAYTNGFSYRGVKHKQLLKFVTEIVTAYPKAIKIKGDGKSVTHTVHVKLP